MSTFAVLELLGFQFLIALFLGAFCLIFLRRRMKKIRLQRIVWIGILIFLMLFGLYGGWIFGICSRLSYSEYLIFEMASYVSLAALIALAFSGVMWLMKLVDRRQKKGKRLSKDQKAWRLAYRLGNGIIIALGICLIGFLIPETIALSKDLSQKAYITYTGAFEVKMNGRAYHSVILKEDEKELSSCFPYAEEQGTHMGKVIYAKHSKLVLSVNDKGAMNDQK